MRLERVRLDRISPSKYNPRKDLQPGDPEYESLRRSVERWDLVEPLVWNERSGNLVGGHQRLKILRARGDAEVDVSVVDLGPDDEAALNVALNKISGEWDIPKLSDLLSELDANGFDATLTGFDLKELEGLLAPNGNGNDPDAVPEKPETPKSKLGEVYELGRHRLMCGDSTDAEQVHSLVCGENVDSVLTDPPYGISQPGVPDDEPEKLRANVWGSVQALPVKDGIVVAFQSTRTFPEWLRATDAAGHKFERCLWLYKAAQMTFPWRGWLLKSEAILLSTAGKPTWNDVHPYSHDCYYLPEVSGELPEGIGWHGSVKPMSVVADLLQRVSPAAGTVFDGFGGSGTTLIAAEQLGRTCYMMELDPGYCDVIRKRYADFVGKPEYAP